MLKSLLESQWNFGRMEPAAAFHCGSVYQRHPKRENPFKMTEISSSNPDKNVNLSIARASVSLSETAPEQACLADRLKGSSQAQVDHAEQISTATRAMSEQLGRLAEIMLLNVGKFRFAVHDRVLLMVEALAADRDLSSGDLARREMRLQQALDAHHYLQLLYITDAHGRQVTRNICNFKTVYTDNGFGRNWSKREWFQNGRNGSFVSDVYRSAATGDLCITVSCPIRDPRNSVIGVLGVDLHFSKLVADFDGLSKGEE